jgi:hypothetical protein
VFVVDTDDTSPRSYGYTKLSGNTSRYGLPAGWIDEAYLYLGSLDSYLTNQTTEVGEETYDAVSVATLEDAREGVENSGETPIVVLAAAFNETGTNAQYIDGSSSPDLSGDAEVWVVTEEGITKETAGATEGESLPAPGVSEPGSEDDPGFLHVLRVIFGLLVLLLPGPLAARWLLRDASFPEWLAAAPALGISIVTVVTIGVLSVTRSPLGSAEAWIALAISIVATAVLAWRSNPPPPDPAAL